MVWISGPTELGRRVKAVRSRTYQALGSWSRGKLREGGPNGSLEGRGGHLVYREGRMCREDYV